MSAAPRDVPEPDVESDDASAWQTVGRFAKPLLPLALFSVALFVLNRELREYDVEDLVAEARALGSGSILAALAVTALNYCALTGYDTLSLTILGRPLPYRRVALASFVAYVFGHNAGLSFLGGGAVRFRLYGSWGLSATEIASVVVLNSLTFWLGFLALLGSALLLYPPDISALTISAPVTGIVGVAALALVAAYLVLTSLRRAPLRIRGEAIALPSLPQ